MSTVSRAVQRRQGTHIVKESAEPWVWTEKICEPGRSGRRDILFTIVDFACLKVHPCFRVVPGQVC